MEDNLNLKQKWKTTSMEDNLNLKQKWKTTNCNGNGGQHQI
jgi:hypothetical protein